MPELGNWRMSNDDNRDRPGRGLPTGLRLRLQPSGQERRLYEVRGLSAFYSCFLVLLMFSLGGAATTPPTKGREQTLCRRVKLVPRLVPRPVIG